MGLVVELVLKQPARTAMTAPTGPHKMNGVPLRRVNQVYVIATSYKVTKTPQIKEDAESLCMISCRTALTTPPSPFPTPNPHPTSTHPFLD